MKMTFNVRDEKQNHNSDESEDPEICNKEFQLI